ncbi:MAG TPA: GNAT family N-acetyltransferase [Caulobacteraceae bacterium]|jgi:predicted acetyltransferase|nr:GNAT family N-acetyltransferase [Caulobacteraceae bacterium]
MTAPAVRLEPVSLADKPALWDMMSPYLIEHADKVDPRREHGDPLQSDYFDAYWTEPERRPYWIVAAGERAGFVLVNAWSPSGRGTQHSIGEFCVTPAARRRGLGREAARLALASAPGLWELQVYRANPEGMAFWPRAIAAAGGADWEIIESDDRVIHRFTTAA